jgi:hypothetical protein
MELGEIMKISKTRFINYLRCNRFAGLEELYQEKDKAIVSFSDDLELEDLMSYENQMKKQVLLESMYDEDDLDLIEKEDVQVIDPKTGEGVFQYDSAGVNSAVDKIMKAMGYYAADKTQFLGKDGKPVDPNTITIGNLTPEQRKFLISKIKDDDANQ